MDSKKQQRQNERRPKLTVPQRGTGPSRRQAPSATTAKNIHININFRGLPKLPTLSTMRVFLRRLLSTKRAIVTTCIIATIVVGTLVTATSVRQHNATKKAQSTAGTSKILENLEYQTVLPSGESIDTLGGWKRVSPPNTDPVYAYTDAIDGIGISVSQQPLPQSFKDNTDGQVADLAKKFDATDKINTDDTTIYLGTSAKGPQSVIFTKNSLLILMKSQNTIADSSWAKYVKSLN